jgi:CDP-diacylglycerol---serine O-phosphatidyltransferase
MQHNLSRPVEIEDPSNRWLVHRLSAVLLPSAVRMRMHPNLVSLAGLGCGVVAALFYWHWREPLAVAGGFAAMLAWHVCDGLDGALARATGQTSAFGRLLDGFCDYATFIMVYLALALSMHPIWLLLAVPAGAAHAAQAAWYEAERERYALLSVGLRPVVPVPLSFFDRGYAWLQRTVMPPLTGFTDDLERGDYRQVTAPAVRNAALFGANLRTLGIAVAALAGHPAIYWLWELVMLSLAAPFFARRLRAAESRLLAGRANLKLEAETER